MLKILGRNMSQHALRGEDGEDSQSQVIPLSNANGSPTSCFNSCIGLAMRNSLIKFLGLACQELARLVLMATKVEKIGDSEDRAGCPYVREKLKTC